MNWNLRSSKKNTDEFIDSDEDSIPSYHDKQYSMRIKLKMKSDATVFKMFERCFRSRIGPDNYTSDKPPKIVHNQLTENLLIYNIPEQLLQRMFNALDVNVEANEMFEFIKKFYTKEGVTNQTLHLMNSLITYQLDDHDLSTSFDQKL